jgi:hypothetical protein
LNTGSSLALKPWLRNIYRDFIYASPPLTLVPALPSSLSGTPTNGQMNLLVGALAVILTINLPGLPRGGPASHHAARLRGGTRLEADL